MTPCPSTDKLQEFIDEKLSDEEYREIDTHIETCEPCQETLERLTGAVKAVRRLPLSCAFAAHDVPDSHLRKSRNFGSV